MKRVALFLLSILPFLVPSSARARTDAGITVGAVSQTALNGDRADAFRGGRTIHFPDGLAITLVLYQPVTGLTAFPGGPPLRPRSGYRFVITSWSARNTTRHTVFIKAWVARSRGMWSREFVTGNGGQGALIASGATELYSWEFQVARGGRVAIVYGPFPAHWLPRGR
jgi:hypothetical protein